MNRRLLKASIVGGVMVVGLIAVPGSLSLNTWVAGPMISDPMDLNHLEAKGQHARWAASVRAAKEEAARVAAREAEEAAARAVQATRTNPGSAVPPKANTTPPRPAPPRQQPAPAPPRDEWMDTYNYWSSVLPGIWEIGDKGSWGAGVPDTGQVWIARRTPLYALKSIMLHEAGHVMQGRAFGGYNGALAVLGKYGGLELTADCWAQARGATFLSYGCNNLARQGAALF